jgi:glycosyltransferase involved in cell wall biosynthesis
VSTSVLVRRPGAIQRPLRIGIVAPPMLPLPPPGYAGTERVITTLALGLHARGHEVTVFAPGDSDLPCELVPVVPRALWPQGLRGNLSAYLNTSLGIAWEQSGRFDVIHSHIDTTGFAMARHCPTPVVTTLHGRLDTGGTAELIDLYEDIPLIAISDSQRRWNPGANWVATIHHGMDFGATPFRATAGDELLLVGRVTREKGVAEAIEVARRTGRRLIVAAKVHEVAERELFDTVVQPAIEEGIVDWRGEVGTEERDELMAGALATLMLGAWPEPFGLVAIESMATGTPVIARRAGAYTETIDHGVNGFLVDDIEEAVLAVSRVERLDRSALSNDARSRFSVDTMLDAYESAFRGVIEQRRDRGELPARRLASAQRSRSRLRSGLTPVDTDEVAVAG